MPAELSRGALENHPGRLHRQRRHRVRFRSWRIKRTGARPAGNSDLPFHFRVVRFEVVISDRPIRQGRAGDGANLAALDEIDLVESPEIRGKMYAGAADTPAINQCALRLGFFVRRLAKRVRPKVRM